MTPQAQRIAIAQACGWKSWPYVVINGVRRKETTWIRPAFVPSFDPNNPHAGCYAGALPPDYLNDLNAMHEAEKTLTQNQRHLYLVWLHRASIIDERDTYDEFTLVTQAAAQRAEAFLRTIGKWDGAPLLTID